ncbi:MAG: hypothetical protein RDV48_03665 [Candidatus Eremiobacteraeota bacterium]|nr:hypothetical protein [Candidatus Eremiobacteraeota bacterium]
MGTTKKVVKKSVKKSLEAHLEKVYSDKYQVVTGVPLAMAKKFIKTLLTQVVKESKDAGTYNLPPDHGKSMLEAAKKDQKVKKAIELKRKEGVTDEDFINWWAVPDVERRLLLRIDETNRMGLFMKFTNIDRMPATEANRLVLKYHPLYGEPQETDNEADMDRPLPAELRERITRYAENLKEIPVEEQQALIDKFSTLNARVRHEIKNKAL